MTTRPEVGNFSATRSRTFDVARRDQLHGDVVQAGIMADNDKTVRAARLADDLEQNLGR